MADPDNASRLGIAALPPFFAFAVRHGYRFEIQGDAPGLADISSAMLEPVYDFFIYSAVPMNEASAARSFAYISDTSSVHATVKGIPTADDQLVRSLQ